MQTPRIILVGGRPVSEWDVSPPPPAGMHYVPGPAGPRLATSEELYEIDRQKKGHPLTFTLAEAQEIARLYWTGERTIAELASGKGVSWRTVSKLVWRKTYWYW